MAGAQLRLPPRLPRRRRRPGRRAGDRRDRAAPGGRGEAGSGGRARARRRPPRAGVLDGLTTCPPGRPQAPHRERRHPRRSRSFCRRRGGRPPPDLPPCGADGCCERPPAADRRHDLRGAARRRSRPDSRGRAAAARDGARHALRARARARGRDPGRAAAAGARRCVPALLAAAGRRLPLGRPRPRPGRLRRRAARRARARSSPALDAFELAVARHADAGGLPILGICRGAQTLNVARGGTLLPAPARRHRRRGRPPPDRAGLGRHARRARRARLARSRASWAPSALRVNSFHHQAVERLGDGLRAVAWAPDGTVEGIEADGEPASCSACSGTRRRSTRSSARSPRAVRGARRRPRATRAGALV